MAGGSLHLPGMLRLLSAAFLFAAIPLSALPPDFAAACREFRTENPWGWSFTQTTDAEGRSVVERYNAAQPDFRRWTLLSQDGAPPSPKETDAYNGKRSRWSRGGTAPHIATQLDLTTAELITEDPVRVVYRFRLKRESASDRTADFLRATLTFHRPSATIELFELSNSEPFSPVFGVRIQELLTRIRYHLPAGDTPALLDKITTRTRGRAYFKTLDADMQVAFTDYAWAGRSGGPARAVKAD